MGILATGILTILSPILMRFHFAAYLLGRFFEGIFEVCSMFLHQFGKSPINNRNYVRITGYLIGKSRRNLFSVDSAQRKNYFDHFSQLGISFGIYCELPSCWLLDLHSKLGSYFLYYRLEIVLKFSQVRINSMWRCRKTQMGWLQIGHVSLYLVIENVIRETTHLEG